MTNEETVSGYDVGPVRVMVLRGDIDVLHVNQLRDAFADAIGRGPNELVVDMAELAFIDSMGLGVIITGYRRAVRDGIRVRLARPSPFARKLLQAMGMLAMFTVDDDWTAPEGH